MKKVIKTAEIISVNDATVVNPLGTVLSGVTRSGAPLNMGGSGDRLKVLFRCEDDSLFEASIGGFHGKRNYVAGSKGILTVKGQGLVSWEPFQDGDNSEASLRSSRHKKRIVKLTAIGLAAMLCLAAAIQLIVFFGSRESVTRVLESEDGSSITVTVNADRRMNVRTQGTHFIVISFRDVLYTVKVPTMADSGTEYQERKSASNNPESGVSVAEYISSEDLSGEIYEIDAKGIREEIFLGKLRVSGVPVRISAEGKKANISRLLSRLSFEN